MTDTLADLVVHYGLALIFVTTLLSCLAIPVPASLVMISAGAFAAGDDLDLAACATAALFGAIIGDQAVFAVGRRGSGLMFRLRGKAARTMAEARRFTDRHGGPGVFFSRWLFSPLAPYVNLIAGISGMVWARFTAFSILGDMVWVAMYVGAGFLFSDQIETVATILGNASGAAAGLVLCVVLGLWLWRHSTPRRSGR